MREQVAARRKRGSAICLGLHSQRGGCQWLSALPLAFPVHMGVCLGSSCSEGQVILRGITKLFSLFNVGFSSVLDFTGLELEFFFF